MNIKRMAGDAMLRLKHLKVKSIEEARIIDKLQKGGAGEYGTDLFNLAPIDPQSLKQWADLSIAKLNQEGKPVTRENVMSAAKELEADFLGINDSMYSRETADTSNLIDILDADEIEF